MKRKLFVLLTIIGLFSVLLGPGMAFAQGPQPPTPEPPFPGGEGGGPGGPVQNPDGLWYMPEGARQPMEAAGVTPLASGGPDDFGYTWDDTVAFSWMNIITGTDTGLSGYSWGKGVGPIALPFSFKYYEILQTG